MTQRTVKSALRVLEVLKLFAERKKAMSQTDIYQGLDMPQSSSNFLLRTMIEAGYLTYHREGRVYFPTPEVLNLGKWLEGFGYDFLFGESVITDLMQDLGDRTGETVSITSQNDIFVHFHRINPRNRPPELQFDQGLVVPLTYSSYGQMLLSRQTDRQVDRVCRLIKARETNPDRRFDLQEMIARITALRAHEYAYSLNPMLPAAGSIATILPITIAGRDVAIGVGGPAKRVEERHDEILAAMRETIEKYTARLLAAFGTEHSLPDANISTSAPLI
ncbi:IclR family transcriptional regulator [Allorhizobium pseudoryzae]|jgi:DNA-binding IclR family transcriptional regulator|uniref:IclR family transcriptional regulator n=1 Tax=Allorhizobium pseudoryzae TaxID=379684 RepID=UPI003CFD3BAD